MNTGRARRRASLAVMAGIAVLGVAGYAAFELAGQVTQGSGAVGPSGAAAPLSAPGASAATPAEVSATPATSTPRLTPAPKQAPPASPRPVSLTPVKAESFGPEGTADGDNPQLAPNVLTDQAAGWRTQWYASARFGALKPGTGLLLDMGTTVTITRVTVRLGAHPGADLELRVSQRANPAAFRTVGAATAASGIAALAPSAPQRARYVLLWCTRLPPSSAGTYQLLVHGVTVEGVP